MNSCMGSFIVIKPFPPDLFLVHRLWVLSAEINKIQKHDSLILFCGFQTNNDKFQPQWSHLCIKITKYSSKQNWWFKIFSWKILNQNNNSSYQSHIYYFNQNSYLFVITSLFQFLKNYKTKSCTSFHSYRKSL